METLKILADFFDWINHLLGVSSSSELAVNPIFLGFCAILFLYAVVTEQKYVALGLFGLLAATAICDHFYPNHPETELYDLLFFLAMMGILAILMIYFGLIRE